MSRPNSPPSGNQSSHLLSLVLHSKKALQHGEQLCSRAHDISRASSQAAVDLLALDTKVRWVTQGIQGQLKLAVSIAKSIELQRANLEDQAKQWDKSRVLHSGNLDTILESLGTQFVPPDFHQSSSSSSLFGSPHSDGEDDSAPFKSTKQDRSKWKTLRDFVDERGIEDALETMDNDRQALDDVLAATEEHPRALSDNATAIRDSLPAVPTLPSMKEIFDSQEDASTKMAKQLESLAEHYDQMTATLRDKEAGVEFSEDDMQDMNRDTDELPSIISELEEDIALIELSYNKLQSVKEVSRRCLDEHRDVMVHLDELGDLMTDMLDQQQDVETECQMHIATLQSHLSTLENLHTTYTSYQTSYNSLLLEMDRRTRYRDAAQVIIKDMTEQLNIIREEELHTREAFYSTHDPHLPDDLCLCIANMPTKWEIIPAVGESLEVLPEVEEDLLIEARKHVDLDQVGSASL